MTMLSDGMLLGVGRADPLAPYLVSKKGDDNLSGNQTTIDTSAMGIVSGDLLVAFVVTTSSNLPTLASFARQATSSDTSHTAAAYTRTAAGAITSIAITGSSTNQAIVLLVFRGVTFNQDVIGTSGNSKTRPNLGSAPASGDIQLEWLFGRGTPTLVDNVYGDATFSFIEDGTNTTAPSMLVVFGKRLSSAGSVAGSAWSGGGTPSSTYRAGAVVLRP
jgi:hypothetical protein